MASLPLIKADDTNLATIPYDWENYAATGLLQHGVDPQIIFLDYDVTRSLGKPSIRIENHTVSDSNIYREVNRAIYPVTAGDNVTVSGWFKVTTDNTTLGYPQCGGRIGLDFYGIVEDSFSQLVAADFWYDYFDGGQYELAYVQDSNGGAWQQRTISIIVPVTAKNDANVSGIVTGICFWAQAAPWTAGESTQSIVWFTDPEMYVNPSAPSATATATITPTVDTGYQPIIEPDHLASGDSFNILVEYQGGLAFQHDNLIFYIEVLNGIWDGQDCQLSMNQRGGTLYFVSNNDCSIQLYHNNNHTMSLTVEGADVDVLNPVPSTPGDFYEGGYEWNATITNGAEVRITWNFPRLLPFEENWMLYIGLAGLLMLIIGIMLSVYAFRHYKILTLGNEETVWEKDILPFCIILVLLGTGLIIVWLLG